MAASLKEKVSPIKPVHIHIDRTSKEGVVFVRFSSLSDCKSAYTALHGMWFNGIFIFNFPLYFSLNFYPKKFKFLLKIWFNFSKCL